MCLPALFPPHWVWLAPFPSRLTAVFPPHWVQVFLGEVEATVHSELGKLREDVLAALVQHDTRINGKVRGKAGL